MKKKVAVVIINWNNWEETLACLENLTHIDLDEFILDTIVVDNGSDDDSLVHLRRVIDIKLVTLDDNRGFAAGSNAGIRQAQVDGCDYVLLLNNDAYGSSDFLTEMLRTFEEHEMCGIVCPKICYTKRSDTDPPVIWYAGGRFRQPRLIGEMIGLGEIDSGQHDQAQIVDFAVGCCMLIDARVLYEVGLLDEDFFFYQEDVNLSYRATLAGFEVWYQPAALIWHHVSLSTEGNLPRRTYLYAMSQPVFFIKHIHGIQWLLVLALESIRLVRTVFTSLTQRDPDQAQAYVFGTIAGWRRAWSRRQNLHKSTMGRDW